MSDLSETSRAVRDFLDQQQPAAAGQQARFSMAGAVEAKPDYEAELARIARQTGVPVDTARAQPDMVRKQATLGAMDFDKLATQFPATTKFLSDQQAARISHDDTGNLTLIETLTNSFKRGWPAMQQGMAGTALRANAGILENIDKIEARMARGERIPDTEDPYAVRFMFPEQRAAFRERVGAAAGGAAGTIARTQGEKAALPSPAVVQQVMQAKGFGEAISAFMTDPLQFIAAIGPESLVQNAPALAAAAVMPGGVAAKAATMGAGSFSTDYGASLLEALGKEGVDLNNPRDVQAAAQNMPLMRRAAAQAMAHASMVGAVDAVSAGVASKVALPARTLARAPVAREATNLLVQTPVQGALGGIGEAAGELAAGGPLEPGQILAEIVGEAFTAPAEVASMAAGQVRHRMEQAQQAEQTAKVFADLNAAVAESKVKPRDGVTFARFVEQATENGPVSDVYISAAALAQSGVADAFLKASPSATQQWATAVDAGTDLRIPIAEYTAAIAGEPFAETLVEHLRTDPNAPSLAEAKEAAPDQRAEVEALLQRQEGVEALATSRQAVESNVLDQLTKASRFTPAVNSQYATLTGAFYATQAARLGVTPEALFAAHPLRIQATSPTGRELLQQGGGQRGSFDPLTRTITLLKAADLTSYLHEVGHANLDLLANLAAQDNAPAEIREDMQKLLDWFHVKPEGEDADALTVWHRLTLDQQRAAHEQFARGFEAYLFTGKAPSIELQGIFQRFRAWLVSIYRSLKALDVELTPDVRAVMDRMLATADQIETAEAAAAMGLLFKTPEEAAQFGIDWKAYHDQGLQASQDAVTALEARSLADMQWLTGARGKELKRLQREAQAKRLAVEREVRADVLSQPIYRAWAFLTGKQSPIAAGEEVVAEVDTEQASGRLRTQYLKEAYGSAPDAPWRKLSALGMTSDTRGIDPDLIGERFGYSGGDELVQVLLTSPTPEEAVAAETDRQMLERYGDISSPEALSQAADEAVHNKARARFVATELNALQAATDARADAGTDKKGRQRTVSILPAAAREFAANVIARLRVRDVRPGIYQAAEARAAREAEKALKAGDIAAAAAAKRNQLINGESVRAARDALAEVDKALKYFARVERSETIDADYRDQITQLLEQYQLARESIKAADKRTSLREWVAKQVDAGLDPEIPTALLDGLDRKSYRDMTIEELRGLIDTVKQIEHIGRLKSKLLTAADQRTYEQVRDDMTSGIVENARGRAADDRTPTTNLGRWFQAVKNFGAAHIKAATWARIFDGGKVGPVWEYLIRPANDRGDQETTMRAAATTALTEILRPYMKGKRMGGKGAYFPSIDRSVNREGVLVMALNTGNAGNLQRLLGGEGWTIDQLRPVLDSLTAEDWTTVQKVWDYMDSFRPEIAAKQRRVYGTEPDWIEPTPVVTKHGTFKGGYYPIKYDPAASIRADEHADAEEAKALLKGAYNAATTRRSFTKSRVEEVKGRPLLYTLQGLYGGVNDVIHDLAWHEWLIDANRLLKSDRIDKAIRSAYGPAAVKQLRTWRDAIAVGDAGSQQAIDSMVGAIRRGVGIAGLGFNVMSAAMQPLGITQSIARVGASWIGKGVMQYIANPVRATREVNEQSTFMANRMRTRFRDLNELRNRVQGQTPFRERLNTSAFVLMLRAQQMVDVPTWLGAYEKATAAGVDDAAAVAQADQSVIDSQGGGQTKDQSAIERGEGAHKIFTVFYSFMNVTLNNLVASGMTHQGAAKVASDTLLLLVVPAVLGALLKDALTPGDAGDDKKLLRKLLGEQAGFLFGLLVGVREIADVAKSLTSGDHGRDYSGPAGLRLIADFGKLVTQARQGEFDDAFRKAAINFTGALMGLPSAQINRTISGAQALKEGKTSNPAALAFGYQEPR